MSDPVRDPDPAPRDRLRLGLSILPAEIGRRTEILLVASLAALGLGLRLVGLSYGLPDLYHPDTPKQLYRVPDFVHGALIPGDTYPTLHMYIVALLLKLLFLLDPHVTLSVAVVAVTARLLNALLGAGLVPVVYVAGRWLFGWQAASVAAALTSVSSLHVLHSHYEMGDIPHAFFVTASVAAATRVLRNGGPPAYLLAGAFAGLAASAKYYGVIVLGSLVTAALSGPRAPWRRTLGRLLLAGLTAVVVFVLTTPKLLLTPLDFLEALRHSPELFSEHPPPPWRRPLLAAPALVGYSLEWFGSLLLAVVALGVLVVLPRRREGLLLLTTPALVLAVYVITRSDYLDDRNLVILAPFVYLAAGATLLWLTGRSRWASLATALVGVAVVVSAVVECLSVTYLFWQPDTQVLADRWLARHAPPPSRIVRNRYYDSVERYQAEEAELLVVDSGLYLRYTSWYVGRPTVRVLRALDFLAERGKLLKRFELSHRSFTSPIISVYDLDAMGVPHAFPPPEDAAPPPERLVFVDRDATPERVGVVVEPRRAATLTLVSRVPLREIGIALSGAGHVRVQQGFGSTRLALTPGQMRLVLLRPMRGFPWFKYFYPITVEARDARVYARILPGPCEIGLALLADRQWARAIAHLESCQGTRWAEPARLLDLAWAHARLGQLADAERAIRQLARASPGLLEALCDLVAEADGDAWRERYRMLAGHGRWFWRSHVFAFRAAAMEPGRQDLIETRAADGTRAALERAGAADQLRVWFAHDFLRGPYLVRFRLRPMAPAGRTRATLSVVRHFQDGVHDVPISREWSGDSAGGSMDVVLPVTTEIEPVRFEGRVFTERTGTVQIEEIAIVPDVRGALAAKLDALRDPRRGGSPPTSATGSRSGCRS